jgi:acetyl esterase/lipase
LAHSICLSSAKIWTEDPGRPLGVAGDSAGASLTVGLALRARDQHVPVAAQLLLYPATDPAMTSPGRGSRPRAPGRLYPVLSAELGCYHLAIMRPGPPGPFAMGRNAMINAMI